MSDTRVDKAGVSNWTLYSNGLLSIDFDRVRNWDGSYYPTGNWWHYADSVTQIEMNCSPSLYQDYCNYTSANGDTYSFSYINNRMFRQTSYPNLTSLYALYVDNVEGSSLSKPGAFYQSPQLQSVAIGTGIDPSLVLNDQAGYQSRITIGTEAFAECPSLSELSIGNADVYSITIELRAFKDCTSLTDVNLSAKRGSIGAEAFCGCTSLESIDISSLNGYYGDSIFEGCSSLREVILPATRNSISSRMFYGCSSLDSFSFPNSLNTIGEDAFNGCTSLESAVLDSNLTSIGANAFANCSSLSEIRFTGDVPDIGENAFDGVEATAYYPYGNESWAAFDFANYGGVINWMPYGDLSTIALSATSSIYNGSPQQARLTTSNGSELAPDLYTLTYYSDEDCLNQVDASDVLLPGTYYVVAVGNENMGCTGATEAIVFEITKAPLSISYKSETIDADGVPAYELSYDGFVGNESVSALTKPAELRVPAALVPGHSYELTPEGAESSNYDITFISGTLVVRARPIAKPIHAENLVYSGRDQTGVTSGVGYTLSGITHATNAGSYTAMATLSDGYIWEDGSKDTLTFTWAIAKAPLMAQFVSETIDPDSTPTLDVSVTGFVNGEAEDSAAEYVAPTVTLDSALRPGHSCTAHVAGGSAKNYDFTYQDGKVFVSPVTIDEPDVTYSFIYDGLVKRAIVEGEGYVLGGVWQATDAGSYCATVAPNDGYAWSDGSMAPKQYSWRIHPKSGALELDETSLTLKVAEAQKIPFMYVGDGTVDVTSSNTLVATASIEANQLQIDAVGAGTARIVISSYGCANYTTPASVTLLVSVESIDLSRCSITATSGIYTGAPFDAQVSVTLPDGSALDAVSSHALHYYSTSSCTNELDADDVKDIGTYWVRAEATIGGRSIGHTDAVSFVIERATLTAAYSGETVDYGKTPAAKTKVTGFVGGENALTAKNYVTPVLDVPDTLERNTTYELTPSGGSAANYRFVYVAGNLVVKPMVVTIPQARTGLVYNGTSQVGVDETDGCLLSGVANATSAGSYVATATLEQGCVWKDSTSAPKTISWSIDKANISSASVAAIADQSYSGSAITPFPSMTHNDQDLVMGRDYGLAYSNNVNAGTASISVEGSGNFTGTRNLTFRIEPLVLTDECVSGLAESYAYTAASITPEPVVTCEGSVLAKGTDYELSYSNNLSSGTAKITVTGKGNYSGSVEKSFEICKASLKDALVDGIVDVPYTGAAITQQATLTLDGRHLVEGEDYSVSYDDNIEVGVATVTFSGIGEVVDSTSRQFAIRRASLVTADVTGVEPSYTYTGSEIKPAPVVMLGSKELVANTDYLVSYLDNVSVGEATVTISGVGNYTGTTLASFAITKASYDLSGLSFVGDQIAYDGKAHSLEVTGELPNGVSVAYEGNGAIEVGSHEVTAVFTGDDNHEQIGSMTVVLLIEKAPVEVPCVADNLVYNGSQQSAITASAYYVVGDGGTAVAAGDYSAIVSLADPDHYRWEDGTVESKSIPWSIAKATLRATYVSEGIVYGETPDLVVEVTGFVNGEDSSTAAGYETPIVASDASDAGSYRLIPSGGSADNYEFAYEAGTLKIGKAPVFVVAHSASKIYGQDDPELTYSVLGAADGEDIGTIALSRDLGEHAGTYEIHVSAPGSNNYRVIALGSSFVIAKATYDLTGVQFANAVVEYDGLPHYLSISGQLPTGLNVSYENNGKSEIGTHTVVAHLLGDADHEKVDDIHAKLTITPCDLAKANIESIDTQVFTGKAVMPKPVVKAGTKTLTLYNDYTVYYANNVNVGTATVTVTGRGNYTGTTSAQFKIQATNRWIKEGSSWYYYGADGNKAKGWQKVGNNWYYLDPSSGALRSGWLKDGGKWYYLDPSNDSRMATGWQKVGNYWYLFASGGAMLSGWQKLGGKWYYLDPANDSRMATGWRKVGGYWYLFASGGQMLSGWQKSGSSWYYLDPANDSRMATGWLKVGNTWYYFNSSGAMVTGRQNIGGKWYTFNSSGAWVG